LCQNPDIATESKQYITLEMINELDPCLLSLIFKFDTPNSVYELFLLKIGDNNSMLSREKPPQPEKCSQGKGQEGCSPKKANPSIPKRRIVLRSKKGSISKKVLSSDLPDYVRIPTQSLQYVVSGLEENMENLNFAAREVPGDGNCLYHALSGSKYFVAKHPTLAGDTSRLRKALVECIQSKKNLELVQYLLNNHPPPGVKNIDGWVKRVNENTVWGSVAEVVMFTHLFQINVVMLLQCYNGVSVWGTYNSYKKQLNHQLSELEYKQRIRYDHTVFLWHHRLGDCQKLIEDPKDANHFSILDVCDHETVDRERDVYLMRNFWKETTTSPSARTCTILDTPPTKK
jgi:hypothetical protein